MTRRVAFVMLLSVVAACAAQPSPGSAPPATNLVLVEPPVLRPMTECAELMQRGERGEFRMGGEGVTPPTPTRLVLAAPPRFTVMPRGTLEVRYDVTPYGRIDQRTLRATGAEGWPDRARFLREVASLEFAPGSVERCAVRVNAWMTFRTL